MATAHNTAPLLVTELSYSDTASQLGGDDSLKEEIQESKRKTAKEKDFEDDVVTKKRTLSFDDMEEHFAFRDQLLCHLAETMDSIELKVLREKEQNFHTLATKLLSQTKDKKQTTQEKDTTETKETTRHTHLTSILMALYRQMTFEIKYVIPALVTLTLDCVAHVATYEFFGTIVGEFSKFFEDDEDDDEDTDDEIAYVLTFLLGIIILRVTGGLWIWVDEDTRAEIKDRDRFTVLPWFYQHYDTVQALAMVCFYLCIIPVYYVYYNYFSMLFLDSRSAALNGLPRLQGKTFLGRSKSGVNNDYPLVVTKLSEADEAYLWKRLTVESYGLLLGDSDAPLVSPTGAILGATLVGILSIFLLKKLHVTFWEME